MHIEEYFSRPMSQSLKRRGTESEWLEIATIEIYSHRLAVGDSVLFPGDQIEVDVKPGKYEVQAKVFDFGVDRRISRLRAFLMDSDRSITARFLGDISVAFARVGICDPQIFLDALDKNISDGQDLELYEAVYLNHLDHTHGLIKLPHELSASMVFVQSGWGSGGYSVFELTSEIRRIGLEVLFIDENEQYLFENAKEFDILYPAEHSDSDKV